MLTAKYTNGLQETLELHRLRIEYEKLLAMYTIILPKINQVLIADLLSREIEYYNEDKDAPMYTIEVFTKNGIDSEKAKMYIIQKTGMVPSILDKLVTGYFCFKCGFYNIVDVYDNRI
jgi:hypothetical protein